MFTGIVETVGVIDSIVSEGTNKRFVISSSISAELKIDQSISHNGVCLTVVRQDHGQHHVVAVAETLGRSTLGLAGVGDPINLERCMVADGRFDGHIVQGHVDQMGCVANVADQNGSWLFDFDYSPGSDMVTVEKGSICINGVSLTCFNSQTSSFRVAIIPYTYEHTSFKHLKKGDAVNLEFDIVGKYVKRLLDMENLKKFNR